MKYHKTWPMMGQRIQVYLSNLINTQIHHPNIGHGYLHCILKRMFQQNRVVLCGTSIATSPWFIVENPSISGWWLGVALWLRKRPCDESETSVEIDEARDECQGPTLTGMFFLHGFYQIFTDSDFKRHIVAFQTVYQLLGGITNSGHASMHV